MRSPDDMPGDWKIYIYTRKHTEMHAYRHIYTYARIHIDTPIKVYNLHIFNDFVDKHNI